jgi:hypothetical protein
MKLFIHEDDFSEIEILPASMADWCQAELARISAFAARHEAPGGAGWTDIYLRPTAPAGLASLAIPLEQAIQTIARHLPRFTEVSTGLYCSPVQVPGALGFGHSPGAAAIVFGDKTSSHVEAINLVVQAGGADAEGLLEALARLPGALIAVDWQRGACIHLTDTAQVLRYLQALS